MSTKQKKKDFVIKDKTLVSWVTLSNLNQRGAGSVLTLEKDDGIFDAIVFAELEEKKWMAGSNGFARTEQQQDSYPEETADKDTLVQMAIVYKGKEVSIYRNGKVYAQYTMKNDPIEFDSDSMVLIGPRHMGARGSHILGSIEDARIYDSALTAEQIAALKPNEPSEPEPLAWWDFEDDKPIDCMGVFDKVVLVGDAELSGGKLILPESGSAMLAVEKENEMAEYLTNLAKASVTNKLLQASRDLRLKMLEDPYRPTYHFVIPEGYAGPFDPNGAVFWNGRYHLGYIYQEKGVHYWGHASSLDLLHWRHHQPSLFPTPDSPETGIFSGNCFINKKGEATMLYHGCGVGNCIATSDDENLDNWQKLHANPIIPSPKEGDPEHGKYASWDPHGWLEGDTYYAIFGGSTPAIFKAKELDKWEYVGDLLAHAAQDVDIHEDVSCPDLFKLGNKRVLVCISHRLGCRYYIGEWKNEQFYPEFHEKMSWVDNAFFAPESLEDDKGRRIMWAWIFDGRSQMAKSGTGWSGTMSLPRVLELDKDNNMLMYPVEELEMLRYNKRVLENISLKPDSEQVLEKVKGNTIELLIDMVPYGAKQFGVKVCCSPDGEEQTVVYYDAEEKKLKIDARNSSLKEGPRNVEAGPFELELGEVLQLRVFVDKSVVEVFANNRQAVMRRIYPTRNDSVGVTLFSNGGSTLMRKVRAWDIMPSNPY